MPLIPPDQDFYDFLREQFSTLAEAKTWGRRWYIAQEQGNPLLDTPCTARAMAAHISNALEGGLHGVEDGVPFTNYLATKHGPEIAMAMWSSDPSDH